MGTHDPSACISKNGKILAMEEEERHTRIKGSERTFPSGSITFCLSTTGTILDEVEAITIPWDVTLFNRRVVSEAEPFLIEGSKDINRILITLTRRLSQEHRRYVSSLKTLKEWIKNHTFSPPQVIAVPHHLSHAAAVSKIAPFRKGLVIISDWRGEFESLTAWKYENGFLEKILSVKYPQSPAMLYHYVTGYLGLGWLKSEGKTMGLSAYGSESQIYHKFKEMIVSKEDTFDFTRITKHHLTNQILAVLSSKIPISKNCAEPTVHQKNLAWAVQKITEEYISGIIESLIQKFKKEKEDIENIALGGGLFLNCRLNGYLTRKYPEIAFFAPPTAGDYGTALGSAIIGYEMLTGKEIDTYPFTPYLGKEEHDEKIESYLKKIRISYENVPDPERYAAELLCQDRIVGWFQGRMEVGPRALGNRSILANPSLSCNKKRVNLIKGRELWRPLAPTILEEKALKILEVPAKKLHALKYMTFTVSVSSPDIIPAVVHVDQTTRPQILHSKDNEKFYRLIKNFENETGIPAVLNTSFNIAGKTIVRTLKDAIRDFYTMGLDYLIINNYVIQKK